MSIRSVFAALVGLLSVLPAPSRADSVFETASFRFALPADWRVDTRAQPARATGPNGATLTLSQTRVSGPGPEEPEGEAREIRDRIEGAARRSVLRAAAEEGMRETAPPRTEALSGGLVIHRLSHQSADGTRFNASFVVLRGRNVLLVTVTGPAAQHAAADTVAERLRAIEWRR